MSDKSDNVRKLLRQQKAVKDQHVQKKFKSDNSNPSNSTSFNDSSSTQSKLPCTFFDSPHSIPKGLIEKSKSLKQTVQEKKELQDSFLEFQKEIEPQLAIVEDKEIQEYEEIELDKLQKTLNEQYDLSARLQVLKNKRVSTTHSSISNSQDPIQTLKKASGLIYEDQLQTLPSQACFGKSKSIKRNLYQTLSNTQDDLSSFDDSE